MKYIVVWLERFVELPFRLDENKYSYNPCIRVNLYTFISRVIRPDHTPPITLHMSLIRKTYHSHNKSRTAHFFQCTFEPLGPRDVERNGRHASVAPHPSTPHSLPSRGVAAPSLFVVASRRVLLPRTLILCTCPIARIRHD